MHLLVIVAHTSFGRGHKTTKGFLDLLPAPSIHVGNSIDTLKKCLTLYLKSQSLK